MSHPTDLGPRPRASPQRQKGIVHPDDRLVPSIRVSKRMKPFVNRIRLRLKDLDLTESDAAARLNQVEEMRSILKKKKIPRTIANQIIAETLDAAANHRLEDLRRDQNLERLAQANRNLNRLIKQVQQLAEVLAKLPRRTKSELNEVMAAPNWRQFDTETFAELMDALLDTLSRVSAFRLAGDARFAIVESLRGSTDRTITKVTVSWRVFFVPAHFLTSYSEVEWTGLLSLASA